MTPVIPNDLLLHQVMGRERGTLDRTVMLVDPPGTCLVRQPQADAGLRGRDIIVETDGGSRHHGGEACSGTDLSQVECTTASMARHIAHRVVVVERAVVWVVQMASSGGHGHPVYVETVKPRLSNDKSSRAIHDVCDTRPAALMACLNRIRPIDRATAGDGHAGCPAYS